MSRISVTPVGKTRNMVRHTGSIIVDAAVTRVFGRWSRVEEYPRFLEGVTEVAMLDQRTARWSATIGGARHEWTARIHLWIPNRAIGWTGFEAPLRRARVLVEAFDMYRSRVTLSLDTHPSPITELSEEAARIVDRSLAGDLERFKAMVEEGSGRSVTLFGPTSTVRFEREPGSLAS